MSKPTLRELKLRCYCCGAPIDRKFALVSYQEVGDAVDRAFTFLPEHVPKVDDAACALLAIAINV